MPRVDAIFHTLSHGLEVLGALVIVTGIAISAARFAQHVVARRHDAYGQLRGGLGRSLLLGLEVLVAGDIIRSVALDPSFESLGVLAIVVLIRTFLAWSLEVEIDGQWPWRRRAREAHEVAHDLPAPESAPRSA